MRRVVNERDRREARAQHEEEAEEKRTHRSRQEPQRCLGANRARIRVHPSHLPRPAKAMVQRRSHQ